MPIILAISNMALRRRRIVTDDTKSSEIPEDIESLILKMKKISTKPLSLLADDEVKDMETLRKLAKVWYSTPLYTKFHNLVIDTFGKDVVYSPHTVGSFFTGCLVSDNLLQVAPDVNPGCSLTSADSLPPDKPWGFCSQNVIWCILSTSSYARNARKASQTSNGLVDINYSGPSIPETFDFVYMTHITSSNKAILFVDYPTYESFPGFTLHEKARIIHRMRISDVKLLSYDIQTDTPSVQYKDLIGNPIKVHAIKTRPDPRDRDTPEQKAARKAQVQKSLAAISTKPADQDPPLTWWQGMILVLALILLVILGISAYFFFKRR